MVLRIPEPYDFELSTARFRDFGSDGATVWHEGGLHRVVAGREVRIAAAAGRCRDRALERRGRGGGRAAARAARSISSRFARGRSGDAVLGPVVEALAGFRPTLNPQPFEALVVAITTQQISLRAAAAIRGNLVERFGVRHERRLGVPDAESGSRELRPRHFTPLGFSRAKAEYVLELAHSDLDLDALAALDDER